MMLTLNSPEQGYSEILDHVMAYGHEVRPRGSLTQEITGLVLEFHDPSECMIVDDVQKQFLESEVETVKDGTAPEMKASQELIDRLDLEEDGTFFEEGIRQAVSLNWMEWIERFQNDPDTRKNAATFTVPVDDNPPCTIAMQFLLRDGELSLMTFNRSQDLMFAFPMDAGLFGTLLSDMAYVLEVDIGTWTHLIGSAHIYEEQFGEARQIING